MIARRILCFAACLATLIHSVGVCQDEWYEYDSFVEDAAYHDGSYYDSYSNDSSYYDDSYYFEAIDYAAEESYEPIESSFSGEFDDTTSGQGELTRHWDFTSMGAYPDGGYDQDGDGLSDDYENANGSWYTEEIFIYEANGNTYSEWQETGFGLNSANPDTDGDGIDDGTELLILSPALEDLGYTQLFDPTNPDDGLGDWDGDDLPNYEEVKFELGNLFSKNSDGDDYTDFEEWLMRSDANDPDDPETKQEEAEQEETNLETEPTDPVNPVDPVDPVDPIQVPGATKTNNTAPATHSGEESGQPNSEAPESGESTADSPKDNTLYILPGLPQASNTHALLSGSAPGTLRLQLEAAGVIKALYEKEPGYQIPTGTIVTEKLAVPSRESNPYRDYANALEILKKFGPSSSSEDSGGSEEPLIGGWSPPGSGGGSCCKCNCCSGGSSGDSIGDEDQEADEEESVEGDDKQDNGSAKKLELSDHEAATVKAVLKLEAEMPGVFSIGFFERTYSSTNPPGLDEIALHLSLLYGFGAAQSTELAVKLLHCEQELALGHADGDLDGIPDYLEIELKLDLEGPDSDGDHLDSLSELLLYLTHPQDSDTDGDEDEDNAEVPTGLPARFSYAPEESPMGSESPPSAGGSGSNNDDNGCNCDCTCGEEDSSGYDDYYDEYFDYGGYDDWDSGDSGSDTHFNYGSDDYEVYDESGYDFGWEDSYDSYEEDNYDEPCTCSCNGGGSDSGTDSSGYDHETGEYVSEYTGGNDDEPTGEEPPSGGGTPPPAPPEPEEEEEEDQWKTLRQLQPTFVLLDKIAEELRQMQEANDALLKIQQKRFAELEIPEGMSKQDYARELLEKAKRWRGGGEISGTEAELEFIAQYEAYHQLNQQQSSLAGLHQDMSHKLDQVPIGSQEFQDAMRDELAVWTEVVEPAIAGLGVSLDPTGLSELGVSEDMLNNPYFTGAMNSSTAIQMVTPIGAVKTGVKTLIKKGLGDAVGTAITKGGDDIVDAVPEGTGKQLANSGAEVPTPKGVPEKAEVPSGGGDVRPSDGGSPPSGGGGGGPPTGGGDIPEAPIRGAGDDLVTVYRGTDIGSELAIFDEAGAILSDAGRSAYLSARGAGGSVDDALAAAYRSSGGAHSQQLSAWGSLDDYVQAHGAFGQEISVFGPRSMISFTTDPDVARRFGSTIFEFQVPRSSLIPQTLPGAGEAEVLLLHGLRK